MSTRAQLLAEIAAQFPDNTTGLITPAKLRQVCEDLANSSSIPETDGASAPASHLTDPEAHLLIRRITLTGNLVLTAADRVYQHLIPDADRDVTLPAEVAATPWVFRIQHVGAVYTLTLKRAVGTAVGVLIPGCPVVITWDGTGISIS